MQSSPNWKTFVEQVKLGSLRWLHSIDLNVYSKTYGVADREYWAWKTKDFANGTCQGGIAGFLDARGLLSLEEQQILQITEGCIVACRNIQRRDGSFEEAYPYESSFCVTALVLFSLLYAYLKYPQYFTDKAKKEFNVVLSSGIDFINRTPETHGTISNHLATALAAKHLFAFMHGRCLTDKEIDDFCQLQHKTEGWFNEYDGCDPGYQTLLNHYLLAAHTIAPLPRVILDSLVKSSTFTRDFCFPDGTFSGEIGCRGTQIFYPSGVWTLDDNNIIPTTACDWFLERHISKYEHVSPTNVDAGNFVPVFNAWSLYYQLGKYAGRQSSRQWSTNRTQTEKKKYYDAAGLLLLESEQAKAVVSLKRGTIRKCYLVDKGRWCDDSLVGIVCDNEAVEVHVVHVEESQRSIKLLFNKTIPKVSYNSWWKALILRLLARILYFAPPAQRWLKRFLAQMVMKRQSHVGEAIGEIAINTQLTDFPYRLTMDGQSSVKILRFGYLRHMASANTYSARAFANQKPIPLETN